jgi:MFS family permease
VAVSGDAAAFWAIVGWYAVTTAVWQTMPADRRTVGAAATSLMDSLREGISFIRSHRVLRWLLPVFAADNFFILGPVNVLLPVLVTRGLGGTSATLGLMYAGYGTGLVLGTVGLDRWPIAARSSMRASLILFLVSDALFGALGVAPSVAAAVLMYALCGFLIGPASVLYRTYLMHVTPSELIGRVSGTTRFTTYGLQPFAQMLAGLVAALLPVPVLFALAGGGGLVADVIGCALGARTPGEALAVPVETVGA